jgi:Extensin-like protein C-terminus
MARCVRPRVLAPLLAPLAALCLTSCGFLGRPERPIWRTQAENACFARKQVTLSDWIVAAPEIDGPGICGMTRPLKVSALDNGAIAVDKVLTIDCPMIPALEAWLNGIVEPDAQTRFGERVATVDVFGAYSCRPIDNIAGDRLSEHAFGNAVDVAGFTLADGRKIDFVHDWKNAGTQEAAFLHEAHAGACRYFTTVLGPGADVFHYNHIHLDLANHGRTDTGPRRICKPTPAPDLLPPPPSSDGLPPAPNIDEPLDIAHLSAPDAPAVSAPLDLSTGPGDGPDAALPPAPIGETDPSPPILPAGVDPGVDRSPTSSIRNR